MKQRALIITFILTVSGFAAEMGEPEKISYLLNRIEASRLLFIRNGTEYSSKRAKEHLEYKLKSAGSRIKTAEDFIRFIASRSSFSGKPYFIKKPDGTIVKSETWLMEELKKLEMSLKSR